MILIGDSRAPRATNTTGHRTESETSDHAALTEAGESFGSFSFLTKSVPSTDPDTAFQSVLCLKCKSLPNEAPNMTLSLSRHARVLAHNHMMKMPQQPV